MFSKFAVVSFFVLFFAMVLASPQPQVDSLISQVTDGAASVASQITSVAGSLGTDATSLGGVLTSAAGGALSTAISAASSAASSLSSKVASSTATGNYASMPVVSIQTPMLAAFATVIFSTLFGAAFVL